MDEWPLTTQHLYINKPIFILGFYSNSFLFFHTFYLFCFSPFFPFFFLLFIHHYNQKTNNTICIKVQNIRIERVGKKHESKKQKEKKKIECQPGAFLQDHTGLKHSQILQSTRTQIFSFPRVTVGACCFSRMCPNLLCLISLRLAHSREPCAFAPLT